MTALKLEAVLPARGPRYKRIMIVGDSMTQGGEGDWTWRYRLWQWLRSEGEDRQFVGPYTGTQDAEQPHPPEPPPLYGHFDPPRGVRANGGYALDTEPDFDSHHFSIWGRQCALTKELIFDQLSEHPADLVLIMLGFNDIGWFVSDAKGTLESMKILVANARSACPNAHFAIANIPQRTPMDGREDLPKSTSEYNSLLREAIPKWTTKRSRIELVELCKEYNAEIASYDGLHPNALGDYQIAIAFSKTLVKRYDTGKTPLDLPSSIPVRRLPTPAAFTVQTSLGGITATWEKAYGCQYYELRKSIDAGEFSTDAVFANRWDSHWAVEGQHYQAQIRSCFGQSKSDWSPILAATAHPKLTPAPVFKVKSTSKGVLVTWEPPSSSTPIKQYTILWKDKDVPAWFPSLGGFKQSPAHIDELEKGHRYDIWMLTWSAAGEGLPGPMQEIIVQ